MKENERKKERASEKKKDNVGAGDDTYQTAARFLLEGARGATIPIEAFAEFALVRH